MGKRNYFDRNRSFVLLVSFGWQAVKKQIKKKKQKERRKERKRKWEGREKKGGGEKTKLREEFDSVARDF